MTRQTQVSNWESIVIYEGSTFKNALETISKGGLQLCIVLSSSQKLKGIITDSDTRKALLKGITLESDIDLILNKNPLVVSSNISEIEAHNLMISNQVFHLPVVDKSGKVIALHVAEQLCKTSPKEESILIMAGGKGKRLLPLTANKPKPMLPIGGKPILEHIINKAKYEGFINIFISINYLAEQIIEYFGDGSEFGVNIKFIKEEFPLGTAGCMAKLPNETKDKPLVITNGDVVTDVAFGDLLKFNLTNKSDATMAVRSNEWQCPYGVIKSKGHSLISLEEKPVYIHQVNAGIYILQPSVLNLLENNEYIDMTDLILKAKDKGLNIDIYPLHESWIDIGKHDDYLKAQRLNFN